MVTDFPQLMNLGTTTPRESISRLSPITQVKIFDTPLSSEKEVRELIDSAKKSLGDIENLGRFERSRLLAAASNYLENFVNEIAHLVHL